MSKGVADRVSEGQDVIDSRDIIARIEELEEERSSAVTMCDHGDECDAQEVHGKDFDESDEGEELKALKALADEAEGSPDWTHGEALIAESYFQEYAEQLAEDIGAVTPGATWPNNCIDWEEAADQLKQDYFSVEYGATTYWIRS